MSDEINNRQKQFMVYIIVTILWLFTAILALYEVEIVRDMVLQFYIQFLVRNSGSLNQYDYSRINSLGQILVLILGLLALGVTVGGFDYHFKHAGERRSWKILAWMLGIQILVLFISWLSRHLSFGAVK